MATKAKTSDIDTEATPTSSGTDVAPAPQPLPEDVIVDNGSKDENGNIWRTQKEGERTRVFLITKDGSAYNVSIGTEDEGRAHLLAFTGQQ